MLASSQFMVYEYSSSKLVQFLEHAARAGLPLMITVRGGREREGGGGGKGGRL
jgi:hypothetical protein